MIDNEHRIVLIDARELLVHGQTGIGRVVMGLVDAMAFSRSVGQIQLAVGSAAAVPERLAGLAKISARVLPAGRVAAERALTRWSRDASVFISPYPKLPITGVCTQAVHIVHDVLDMTQPPYCHRLRTRFDRWRLARALKRADLTWFDSAASMDETRRLAGHAGRRPCVRFPGIDDQFTPKPGNDDRQRIGSYGLDPGYLLAVGNGRPHKNLGVALTAAETLGIPMAVAGAGSDARTYWESFGGCGTARWIGHVADEDLPALYRGARCLVQPSLAEGYGYPPLEAMASGVPAIVSSIDVLCETTGGHAVECDPLSPDQWQEAISALDQNGHRSALIADGLDWSRRFQGRAGWQAHVDDIETLLNHGDAR